MLACRVVEWEDHRQDFDEQFLESTFLGSHGGKLADDWECCGFKILPLEVRTFVVRLAMETLKLGSQF